MKTRARISLSIIMLIVLSCTFLFTACGQVTFTLASPQLKYDGEGIVYWDKIASAQAYLVNTYEVKDGNKGDKIGEGVKTEDNSFVVQGTGTFCIGVVSLSYNALFLNSTESYIFVQKDFSGSEVVVPDNGNNNGNGEENNENGEIQDSQDVLPSSIPKEAMPIGTVYSNQYFKTGSNQNLFVDITKEANTIDTLICDNEIVSKDYWSFDNEKKQLIIDYKYFTGLLAGKTMVFKSQANSQYVFEFFVQTVNELPSQIANLPSYDFYYYNKKNEQKSGIEVEFSQDTTIKAIAVDGVKVNSNTTKYYGVGTKSLTLKDALLQELDYGYHKVEVFTTKGILDFMIFVYSASFMAYNLSFDYNSAYPDIYLNWNIDYPVDKYEVVIGDSVYSSDEYPQYFDGNAFKLSGLVNKGTYIQIRTYVDGVEKFAVSEKIAYNFDFSNIESYLSYNSGFNYLGTDYNRYINSIEELEYLAYYMILNYDKLATKTYNLSSGGSIVSKTMGYIDVYFNEEVFGLYGTNEQNAQKVKTAFGEACASYKESIKYSWITTTSANGGYEIAIDMASVNSPLYDSTTQYVENDDSFHLEKSTRTSTFDDFKIYDREYSVEVTTSDELYFAIEAGYNPIPVAGSEAENIYNIAKDVLREYVDDSMTDYEKVHTIYDWLGANVIYDYNLLVEMGNIQPSDSRYDKFYSYDSFYMEGVFENGVAVCNGIAKSFVLLCGLEGITAYKVNGIANGGAHAWNKVFVAGRWYIVDSTWSNIRNSAQKTESFSHEFLMITEEESYEDGRREATEDTLDFYCYDVNFVYSVN